MWGSSSIHVPRLVVRYELYGIRGGRVPIESPVDVNCFAAALRIYFLFSFFSVNDAL